VSKQRREEILRRLHRLGYVGVRQLAAEYGVDTSTIRRDLDVMAQHGMVARSHGGATLPAEPPETPYVVKIETNVAQKRAIARAMAEAIPDGSSLLMDSGSTTLEVAKALRGRKDLTVITNDLRVAAEVANQGEARLVVLGGEVLPAVYTLVSERAVALIGEFHADYAVMGADAVDPRGITNVNSNEVSMKRAMMHAADHVVVVADSSKFGRSALVRVADLDGVELVVTDDGLADEQADEYPVTVWRIPPETFQLPGQDHGFDATGEPAVVPVGSRPTPVRVVAR
jgi:DeoR family transcriptional regulator, aga operon transcriptional repressor